MENILKIDTDCSEEIQHIQFIFPGHEKKQVAITRQKIVEERNGLRSMELHFTTPMVNYEGQKNVTASIRVILLSYESLIFCVFTYINGDPEILNTDDNKVSAGGSSSEGNSSRESSAGGSSSEGSSSNESSSENSDNQYDCNFGDFLFDNMSRSEIEEIGRKYKSTKDMFGYRLIDHLLIRGCKEWAKVILEATKATPWGFDILGTSTMEWCAFNGTFEIIKEFFLDYNNVNDLDLKNPEFISPYLKEKYQDSHLNPHEESNHSISFSLNETGNKSVATRKWFDDFEYACLFLKQLTRNHDSIGPRLDSVRITKSCNVYIVEYVSISKIIKEDIKKPERKLVSLESREIVLHQVELEGITIVFKRPPMQKKCHSFNFLSRTNDISVKLAPEFSGRLNFATGKFEKTYLVINQKYTSNNPRDLIEILLGRELELFCSNDDAMHTYAVITFEVTTTNGLKFFACVFRRELNKRPREIYFNIDTKTIQFLYLDNICDTSGTRV